MSRGPQSDGMLGPSRWVLPLVAAHVVALLVAPTAHAAPDTSPAPLAEVLDWHAPEGCPDVVALEQSLKDVLGEPLDFGRLERVRGSVERRASDWTLTLELIENGRRRTRLITARACADLADASSSSCMRSPCRRWTWTYERANRCASRSSRRDRARVIAR